MNAGLRAIDWERGNPYVWKMEDLQYLLETEHLFARKFDSQNMDVVIMQMDEAIEEFLMKYKSLSEQELIEHRYERFRNM